MGGRSRYKTACPCVTHPDHPCVCVCVAQGPGRAVHGMLGKYEIAFACPQTSRRKTLRFGVVANRVNDDASKQREGHTKTAVHLQVKSGDLHHCTANSATTHAEQTSDDARRLSEGGAAASEACLEEHQPAAGNMYQRARRDRAACRCTALVHLGAQQRRRAAACGPERRGAPLALWLAHIYC